MLKNYLVIGTMIGEILLYSLNGAQLLIKINAHCRQINAISTASDNNYVCFALITLLCAANYLLI